VKRTVELICCRWSCCGLGAVLIKISFACFSSTFSMMSPYNRWSISLQSSLTFSRRTVMCRMAMSSTEISNQIRLSFVIFKHVRTRSQHEGDANMKRTGVGLPKWAWILTMSVLGRIRVTISLAENIVKEKWGETTFRFRQKILKFQNIRAFLNPITPLIKRQFY